MHIGAVASIHRFGSSLNTHVHFHISAMDGVFDALEGMLAPLGFAVHRFLRGEGPEGSDEESVEPAATRDRQRARR